MSLWSCDVAGPGAAVWGATLDLMASMKPEPWLSLDSSMGWMVSMSTKESPGVLCLCAVDYLSAYLDRELLLLLVLVGHFERLGC